ncbi:MAG: hypothetical protein K8L99_12070 [Anaerolineae bacterium]|nr:hypothetical protein [Anaerolineae bacterium]CAG0944194.1 hypothetical protein ANRL1_01632 [Anaerolineae bacterium]
MSQVQRIFQIGATRIVADDSFRGVDNESARQVLKASYPEVANATIRERTLDDGTQLVEYLPQPGRKG